ncbi:response regulator [Clostridium sp. MCC353]|uniref:response regulator n=1 Tax=Clostridium sp. MCC353 TaxID=2592646 RepID=UPI001C026CAC|nr:response regulator [Clostridium sp. MCC353]
MSSLMIVEDEPIERAALKLMIQANCPLISRIEEAENGLQALELCKKLVPDIVMVDINMPGINGLETIREMKKVCGRSRYIILSSYNHFEYAQKALTLGVEQFLLKPAKISELKKVIEDVILKISAEQETEQKKSALLTSVEEIKPIVELDCIYGMISGKSREELQRLISFLGFEADTGFCFVCSYEKNPRYLLRKVKGALQDVGLNCIGELFHTELVFYILSRNQIEMRKTSEVGHFVRMLLDELGRSECRLGIGTIYELGSGLRESYREALRAVELCEESSYLVYKMTGSGDKDNRNSYDEVIAKILNGIKSGEEEAVLCCTGEILRAATINTYSFKQLKENIYQFMILCLKEIQRYYVRLESADYSRMSIDEVTALEDHMAVETYIRLHLKAVLEETGDLNKEKSNQIVGRALNYIESNYQNNIMLEQVAEALDISPYYLSRLLKKYTEKNFTDLLSEKRVEEAKKLLKGPKSIKEITYEVGFNSQNYFAKIFKKYENCTPTEYRANKGE